MFPYSIKKVVWYGKIKNQGKLTSEFTEKLEEIKTDKNKALLLMEMHYPVYTVRFDGEIFIVYITNFPGKQVIDAFSSLDQLLTFLRNEREVNKIYISRAAVVEVDSWMFNGRGFWGKDNDKRWNLWTVQSS